jgi:S1-C subfamily serine protease
VKVGGDIIVSLDGRTIRSDTALGNAIERDKPGQTVTLGIVRGQRHETVKVTLGTRPESLPASG